MKVRNYQELIVWQKAMDLVEQVYATRSLRAEESAEEGGYLHSFKHC